jgi:cystathionine beta-lyase
MIVIPPVPSAAPGSIQHSIRSDNILFFRELPLRDRNHIAAHKPDRFAPASSCQPAVSGHGICGVVHEGLGGNSAFRARHDLFDGILVTHDDLCNTLLQTQHMIGGILGPFDAWLVLRGIKTLAVRMEAIQRNALAVAHALEDYPRVARVLYPGLPSHPRHSLAARQMRGFRGLATIGIEGESEATVRVVGALRVVTSAVSFGGVQSLAEIAPHHLREAGMESSLGLVRLSIDLEHAGDLIADLHRVLAAA